MFDNFYLWYEISRILGVLNETEDCWLWLRNVKWCYYGSFENRNYHWRDRCWLDLCLRFLYEGEMYFTYICSLFISKGCKNDKHCV